MISSKKIFLALIKFMFFFTSLDDFYLAKENQNSIIKLLCLNSFKEEMIKAKIEYSEEIANQTCKCYLQEFVRTASHHNAVKTCKLDAEENLKLGNQK